MDKLMLRI